MSLVVDPSKEGLRKVLRPWEEIALSYVWEHGEGISRDVYFHANKELEPMGKSISRASIINFLSKMADLGVLDVEFETCKGGNRGIYTPLVDESGFKKMIAKTVLESLMKDFLPETKDVMEKFL